MSITARAFLDQAPANGVRVELDGDDLWLDGDVSDRVIEWARVHKDAIVAELRKPKDLNALLDEARSGTQWTHAEAKGLFAPLDLMQLKSGELSLHAAQHFLREHQARGTCRTCLNGGCRACDYRGIIHNEEKMNATSEGPSDQ